MKKIINNKKYDTETATVVGEWSNGGSWNDFNHCEETLYQKRTGEFFLFGEGGARTQYAERVDNNCWSAGEDIIPLSYEDAQKWAEEHLDADDYEEIFGEVTEDGSKKTIAVNLSVSTIENAKRYVAQKGISLSTLIEQLLIAEMNKD